MFVFALLWALSLAALIGTVVRRNAPQRTQDSPVTLRGVLFLAFLVLLATLLVEGSAYEYKYILWGFMMLSLVADLYYAARLAQRREIQAPSRRRFLWSLADNIAWVMIVPLLYFG